MTTPLEKRLKRIKDRDRKRQAEQKPDRTIYELVDDLPYRLMILTAYQRSGTNMLGWAIHSHPKMHYTSEIFRDEKPETVARLEQMIREAGDADPEVETVCVDVKYNQVTPLIRQLMEHPQVKVLHLVREDDKRHWFSFELRTWWNDNPDMREIRQLPYSMFFRADAFEEFVERKYRLMATLTYLQDTQLTYEELTDNEWTAVLPDEACRAICECAGVEFDWLDTHTLKSAPQSLEAYGEEWL